MVFAPSPALPHPLGSWPGLPDTLGPAEAGLRRMAGAGLLLAAAAAHALFDFSVSVRQKPYLGDINNVKEAIIMWVDWSCLCAASLHMVWKWAVALYQARCRTWRA